MVVARMGYGARGGGSPLPRLSAVIPERKQRATQDWR